MFKNFNLYVFYLFNFKEGISKLNQKDISEIFKIFNCAQLLSYIGLGLGMFKIKEVQKLYLFSMCGVYFFKNRIMKLT